MVPSLFQEVIHSYLVFSRVLSFFKTSTCILVFFQGYWVNSPFQCNQTGDWSFFYYKKGTHSATHFFKFTAFFSEQKDLWQRDIIVINNDTSFGLRHFYIDDIACYLAISVSVIHFFYTIISREHLKWSIISCGRRVYRTPCLFHNTYCSHPL